MSDILANLKDAVNPKRREKATPPDYDAQKLGAHANAPPSSDTAEPKLLASDADNTGNPNAARTTAPDTSPKLATDTGFNAPKGTYGPHQSRLANALDPRVDSDRDGHPAHGVSGYGGAAAQPKSGK
ncbi:hypothetical protein QBC47DRAFT_357809 [Echria macrotheca]|uniref:Uncharacterized protein n=1 Tax=Echria macrotheca TaxID=438768 RepID=A0AAJ0BNC6_9PEZI|nr:hypothetical protein QBC47DRAFT_357809 [Echria macrotheca]